MELDKKSFALTCGILCGAGVFVTTLWILVMGKPEGLTLITSVYPGYCVSTAGAFIGLIGGFVFSGLYNKLLLKPL